MKETSLSSQRGEVVGGLACGGCKYIFLSLLNERTCLIKEVNKSILIITLSLKAWFADASLIVLACLIYELV